jgi:hypothetical protein
MFQRCQEKRPRHAVLVIEHAHMQRRPDRLLRVVHDSMASRLGRSVQDVWRLKLNTMAQIGSVHMLSLEAAAMSGRTPAANIHR